MEEVVKDLEGRWAEIQDNALGHPSPGNLTTSKLFIWYIVCACSSNAFTFPVYNSNAVCFILDILLVLDHIQPKKVCMELKTLSFDKEKGRNLWSNLELFTSCFGRVQKVKPTAWLVSGRVTYQLAR